jgi:hypothetical protein
MCNSCEHNEYFNTLYPFVENWVKSNKGSLWFWECTGLAASKRGKGRNSALTQASHHPNAQENEDVVEKAKTMPK